MTRPRIVILVPPDILGGRRRLFERFSDAVTHRADRLFPEAETVCQPPSSTGTVPEPVAPLLIAPHSG